MNPLATGGTAGEKTTQRENQGQEERGGEANRPAATRAKKGGDYAAMFGKVSPSLTQSKKQRAEAQRARYERAAKFLERMQRESGNDESRGHGTPRQGRQPNQGTGAVNDARSTKGRADAYLKLCRNPLQDLRGWLDENRRGGKANHHLFAGQGKSLAANGGLQQVRAEGVKSSHCAAFKPASRAVAERPTREGKPCRPRALGGSG